MFAALAVPGEGVPATFYRTLGELLGSAPGIELAVVTPAESRKLRNWPFLLRPRKDADSIRPANDRARPWTAALSDREIADRPGCIWIDLGGGPGATNTAEQWRIILGQGGSEKRVPAGFWELYHGSKLVRVDLLSVAGPCKQRLLAQTLVPTVPYSLPKTRARVYGAAARLVARGLKQKRLHSLRTGIKLSPVSEPKPPRTLHTLRFLAGLLPRACARAVQKYLLRELWTIGLVEAPMAEFIGNPGQHRIHWLHPRDRKSLRADPFVFDTEGGALVLYEHMDFLSGRGRIDAIRYCDGEFVEPGFVALTAPQHLSFPSALRYEGKLYCVPESARGNEVALYRVSQRDGRCSKVRSLLPEFAGTDPLVVRHGDLWWLFSTMQGTFDLYIWYASDLFGDWAPHALNPVISDVCLARSAGSMFYIDDKLMRPTQDCSARYGGRVLVNHVQTLTTTEFRQRTLSTLEPFLDSPYYDGLHTLSGDGRYTVIDGKRMIFTAAPILQRLRKLTGR